MGAIKVLRAVLGVILCLALGASLWLTVQRQVFRQEQVTLAGATLRPVEEDTMAPAFTRGDLALAVPGESYQLGDAVLCVDGTFQRLVGSTDGDFIARGDSQGEEAEALLPPEQIQGRVVAALPGAGRVYQFLSSWWGTAVVLAVGALLLALPSVLGLGRAPASEQREPRPEKQPKQQPGKYRPRH